MAPISPRSPELNQLVVEPRETLDAEIKEWLDLTSNDHRALVAKEVIALANHGDGYLIIGFEEQADGSFKPAGSRPPTLDAWSQDAIQSIVGKYIDPTNQCRVVHQAPSASADRYPIVIVPGGHRVLIRAKSGSPDGRRLCHTAPIPAAQGPRVRSPKQPKNGQTVRACAPE
jgi:hypothetical protein